MYLSIICASLPVVYSLLRSIFLGKRATAHDLSTGAKGSMGPLVTIGGTSNKFARLNHSQGSAIHPEGSGYEVLCEPAVDGETRSMAPLDPVRVRTEYSVLH